MTINTFDVFKKSKSVCFKALIRGYMRRSIISILSTIKSGSDEKFIRCLYCHYVFDDQVSTFKDILQELSGIGKFITTDELYRLISGDKKLDGNYFHLSFDDGFRNNYTNAAKVLSELKMPAIFFVPSDLIGSDYDKVRKYCVETTKYPGHIDLLRLSDLKEMISLGFEIGSHTRTHVNLGVVSENLLMDEIAGSKNDLQNMLGVECRYISWPYGESKHIDDLALRTIKESGYELCFSAIRGTVKPACTDKYRIPRHHFEVDWPKEHIKYFLRGNFEKI